MAKELIDTSLMPTRRVIVGAIAAIVTAVASQLAAQYEWAAFLNAPAVLEALPVFVGFFVAYMTADPAPASGETVDRQTRVSCHPLAVWLAVLVGFLVLGGCATSSNPEVRWASAEKTYIGVMDVLIDYRKACVPASDIESAGPDHPLCLLDDEAAQRVEVLRGVADQLLLRLKTAGPDDDPAMVDGIMGDLEFLLDQLVRIKLKAQMLSWLPGPPLARRG